MSPLVWSVLVGAQLLAGTPVGAWYPGATQRQKLTVTADAGTPTPYSLAVTLDHRALVTAGVSRADGQDVRLVRWTGAAWQELDRVLDTGSQWNAPTTQLWFAMPVGLADGGTDDNDYLVWGALDAGAPREDPTKVFLFSDDFEDGTLGRWQKEPVDVAFTAGPGGHLGSWALVSTAVAGTMSGGYIFPTSTLSTKQMYFDAWWKLDDPNARLVQLVLASTTHVFDCGLDMIHGGFELARYDLGPGYMRLVTVPQTVPVGQWLRVGTFYDRTTGELGLELNGAPAKRVALGSGSTPGTVGFYREVSAGYASDGGAVWRVDDVRARFFSPPEPRVTVGAVEILSVDGGVVMVDGGTGSSDGGIDPGKIPLPHDYLVGCGCTAGAGPLAFALALLVLRRRR